MYDDYQKMGVGLARVIDQRPVADVRTADMIMGFWLDNRNILRNDFRIMPLFPDVWNAAAQPTDASNVLKMVFHRFDGGERPEILFLCSTGVFRYSPWDRNSGVAGNRGMREQGYWRYDATSLASISPQANAQYRPQAIGFGNAIYFSFTDGSGIWVWDGKNLRPFGYRNSPPPPSAQGPARNNDGPNAGGFSVRGRVGDLNSDWADTGGNVVGGIEPFQRQYWVVYENEAGGYSPLSPAGTNVTLRQQLGDTGNPLDRLRKRFWVRDIGVGPEGTRARILLASKNLEQAQEIDDTLPHFLHRIPNNQATEYIDDVADGELGGIWEDREPAPAAFFVKPFGGSMFLMRTQGNPSRIWWTEQGSVNNTLVLESCIAGHWRDVFPETGAITGALNVRLPGDNAQAAMLIYKERAVHFISGQYPFWRFGTLHTHAGLEGPDLVQSSPDGSVVWYGSRTFWRLDPKTGQVVDIGLPLRRRLNRINPTTARYGQSWVDESQNEVVFCLPQDDSDLPDLQFVWDYHNQGWRLRNDVQVKCALSIPGSDVTLLAGFWDGDNTVWVYHRGYPGYDFDAPMAIYRTAWFPQTNPEDLHDQANTRELIFLMEESYQGTANLVGYQDWNPDLRVFGTTDAGVEDEFINLHHPEQPEQIAFYAPEPAATATMTETAQYDSDVYRTRRVYQHQISVMIPRASVVQFELHSVDHMAFFSLDAYGPHVASGGGNTPRND